MEILSKGGTVLALFDKSRYSASQTRLSSGDVLCFYTDGVIETWNQAEEEFRAASRGCARAEGESAGQEILKTLAGELKKFAHGAEHDDITAFILKVPR